MLAHTVSELVSSVKPWSQDSLIAAGAYLGFCSMKRLEVFLLPLDEMLVHRRSLLRICQVSPTFCRYPFIHLGGEGHCENKLPWPRTLHNVPGQGSNRTARSGVERANHEATAPPTHQKRNGGKFFYLKNQVLSDKEKYFVRF